jgi:predicted dehydrogenase
MTLTHISNVKIVGAGSIGNHLAHAARTLGCSVVVTDVSPEALDRMRHDIYPGRYGRWDDGIELRLAGDAPVAGFDLICIGTPPDTHIPLALQALRERPAALQIEKPLCTPDLGQADELAALGLAGATRVFVGYDHAIGKAARRLTELLGEQLLGEIKTMDVEFREFWGGIFKAHPWLSGPEASYLGFWKRGGGASGEHSHALHFWQYLSHVLGAGRVVEVDARLRYVENDRVSYDECCFCTLRTESGLTGRVVQDVVTQPVKKEALVQGTLGSLRWISGYEGTGDAIVLSVAGRAQEVFAIPKTRPEDFIEELVHIDRSLDPAAPLSPLALERGLETMLVVAAAHRAEQTGRRIRLDYTKGFTPAALS